jgi:hypothetical protein
MAFAEDSEYVKRLYKKGLKYKIFKDPRYLYSLRHYKRDGKLRFIGNTAKLNLKSCRIKDRPSKRVSDGWSVRREKAVNGISLFVKEIKIALKKPKLLKKIKRYLSSPEGDF